MRIAIVQRTFNSTTVGWVQGLLARGHEVRVVVASDREPLGGIDGIDVRVVADMPWTLRAARRLRPGRSKATYVFPSPRQLRRALHGCDVVLLKVNTLRTVVASLVALSLRARRISWAEQLPPIGRRWRLMASVGIMPRRVFVTNDARPGGAMLPQVEGALPRISYAAPMWPVRSHAVAPTSGSSAGPVRVLVVASFKNHLAKRQWWVLEAAARAGLVDGRVRFRFVGVGKPSDEGYRRVVQSAQALGIAHLVDLEVGVAYADMPALFDQHDLVILPSAREQFGMTVVEAMERGLPVIVSDVVGALGCVVPERTGLVFPVDDLDALARALRRLVEDATLRASFGAAALEVVAEHLEAKVIAKAIEGFATS